MLGYYDIIYLMHFLFIGPLLVYVGYYREKAPKEVLQLVMALGAIVTVYHAYKFGQSMYFKSKMNFKEI
tara:strand:+ start:495 stop:701 length:207 start_codon:yes stop_codon:yes gene_type:complete